MCVCGTPDVDLQAKMGQNSHVENMKKSFVKTKTKTNHNHRREWGATAAQFVPDFGDRKLCPKATFSHAKTSVLFCVDVLCVVLLFVVVCVLCLKAKTNKQQKTNNHNNNNN